MGRSANTWKEGERESRLSGYKWLCSVAVDWEVSGSMLILGTLPLMGFHPASVSLMPLCSAPWCLVNGICPMPK